MSNFKIWINHFSEIDRDSDANETSWDFKHTTEYLTKSFFVNDKYAFFWILFRQWNLMSQIFMLFPINGMCYDSR